MSVEMGLVGRPFLIWGDDNKWNRQGYVVSQLEGGHYLVRFFDALFGEPSTFSVFHISQFVGRDGGRVEGAFEFFEDTSHLRDWLEARG